MKTIICNKPGEFLLAETPEPKPGPEEALVRIRNIGICGTDLHAYQGQQPFFEYPRILGHELSAEVIDPGGDPRLKKDDHVVINPYLNCGECIACRRGKDNCCK
ncbi:MAG: alcohol dehydrogenase catalytic domain-containing protein, partial [Opitutales bacterium]|nr:alcohol dehydrogenase catalytic domain-containing protein [Opitutales bacterium]